MHLKQDFLVWGFETPLTLGVLLCKQSRENLNSWIKLYGLKEITFTKCLACSKWSKERNTGSRGKPDSMGHSSRYVQSHTASKLLYTTTLLFVSHFVKAKKVTSKANRTTLYSPLRQAVFYNWRKGLLFSLPAFYDRTGVVGEGSTAFQLWSDYLYLTYIFTCLSINSSHCLVWSSFYPPSENSRPS